MFSGAMARNNLDLDMSPLHTQLLVKRASHCRIYSSEDEEAVTHPVEVMDIHCDSSGQGCLNGGSSQPQEQNAQMQDGMESDKEFQVPMPDVSQVNETVIKFTYQGDASAWESESDSDTSMPDFKRGKHADTHEDSPEQTDSGLDLSGGYHGYNSLMANMMFFINEKGYCTSF